MNSLFWILAVPALAIIALAAIVGARVGQQLDRARPPRPPVGHKPRPLASRILSALFCVAIVSAWVLATHRRNMDLYPVAGVVFMTLFLLGGAAGIVNRRLYGFWI
ncbi:MAG: hypothetical protein Q7U72_15535 [Brevundimonas sp.]|uniref:hypothetical protein n=1 Tax=Brevundimonas sp. TaxID=1871086 RepID=UPI002719F3B4|nr:hypothetical protein [Brevundimonas sp.]MDO9078846.1 hypothetical protein [Brevundimonas sp.]MDZ4060237.1 hypothetical protein [Brevundimonas sp.]